MIKQFRELRLFGLMEILGLVSAVHLMALVYRYNSSSNREPRECKQRGEIEISGPSAFPSRRGLSRQDNQNTLPRTLGTALHN